MKKVLSLILCGILIFSITGCKNNKETTNNSLTDSNNLENSSKETQEKDSSKMLKCSGDFLFTWGFMIGTNKTPEGKEIKTFAFSNTDSIGDGEYEFTFDNDKLISMHSTETLSASNSNQISDSELNSPDSQIKGCKLYRNTNKRVVVECNHNETSDYVNVLNTSANTKDKLKDILEKNTSLTCK